MTLCRRAPVLVVIVLAMASPTAQTRPPCTDFATTMKNVSAAPNGTTTISNYTCPFNRAAVTIDCQVSSDLPGGSRIQQSTTQIYASIDDFVSQYAVVPPLNRSQRLKVAGPDSGGRETSYTYDAQKRLVREVTVTASGQTTLTWSEWDGAGRPTKGIWTSPGPFPANGQVETVSYDDAARTSKRVTSASPYAGTMEIEFDKNGNQSRVKVVNSGGTTTSTMEMLKTEQVCR